MVDFTCEQMYSAEWCAEHELDSDETIFAYVYDDHYENDEYTLNYEDSEEEE